MPTYQATWTGVPQITVSGDDLFDVLAEAASEYADGTGDLDDDPGYVSPEFRWAHVWHEGKRRRLVLVADGVMTDMHVDEVPVVEANCDRCEAQGCHTFAEGCRIAPSVTA